jgi:hypothetical protein
MSKRNLECLTALVHTGIDWNDAWALRRVAMTLDRWHELECGTDAGAIERDEKTNVPHWRYSDGRRGRLMADREAGALARLARIMRRYPTLTAYVQGDPRGAALYILRPGDVPEGKDADAYYNRGIAVYK